MDISIGMIIKKEQVLVFSYVISNNLCTIYKVMDYNKIGHHVLHCEK